MSEYEIEDSHPLPAVAPHKGKSEKYPWRQMEVGSSFFVADVPVSRIKSSASKAKKRTGRTFVVRQVEGGVRVWRYE